MCFSPLGESIFGYSIEADERLSCECSRKFWELEEAPESSEMEEDFQEYMA